MEPARDGESHSVRALHGWLLVRRGERHCAAARVRRRKVERGGGGIVHGMPCGYRVVQHDHCQSHRLPSLLAGLIFAQRVSAVHDLSSRHICKLVRHAERVHNLLRGHVQCNHGLKFVDRVFKVLRGPLQRHAWRDKCVVMCSVQSEHHRAPRGKCSVHGLPTRPDEPEGLRRLLVPARPSARTTQRRSTGGGRHLRLRDVPEWYVGDAGRHDDGGPVRLLRQGQLLRRRRRRTMPLRYVVRFVHFDGRRPVHALRCGHFFAVIRADQL